MRGRRRVQNFSQSSSAAPATGTGTGTGTGRAICAGRVAADAAGAARAGSDLFQLPRFTPWNQRQFPFTVRMLNNLRSSGVTI